VHVIGRNINDRVHVVAQSSPPDAGTFLRNPAKE
jgi:hypothetical protein